MAKTVMKNNNEQTVSRFLIDGHASTYNEHKETEESFKRKI